MDTTNKVTTMMNKLKSKCLKQSKPLSQEYIKVKRKRSRQE